MTNHAHFESFTQDSDVRIRYQLYRDITVYSSKTNEERVFTTIPLKPVKFVQIKLFEKIRYFEDIYIKSEKLNPSPRIEQIKSLNWEVEDGFCEN